MFYYIEKQTLAPIEEAVQHVNENPPVTVGLQRPSVIRTLESPTFNEIRDRFKDVKSPVNDLQKWVMHCFREPDAEPSDFPKDLTPPSTPIENKVITFTAQKLFEAFDAAKQTKSSAPSFTKEDSSYNSEPIELIFSSKQPVCSTMETTAQSKIEEERPKEVITGVITPHPSPKNDSEFFNSNTNVREQKVQSSSEYR